MLLFRSDEHIDRWCAVRRVPKGAVVPLDQLWQLAKRWYANRLDSAWTPRSSDAAQEILASVGLTGDFWRLT